MNFYKNSTTAVGFLLLLTPASVLAEVSASEPEQGKLIGVVGAVTLNDISIPVGTPVRARDVVVTKDGRAVLLLGRKNVIHLSPNTELRVDEYSHNSPTGEEQGAVTVSYGTFLAAMSKERKKNKVFQIRTRAAIFGVRGTTVTGTVSLNPSFGTMFAVIEGEAIMIFTRTSPGVTPPNPWMNAGAPPDGTLKAGQALTVSEPTFKTTDKGTVQIGGSTFAVQILTKTELNRIVSTVGIPSGPINTLNDLNVASSGMPLLIGNFPGGFSNGIPVIPMPPQIPLDPVINGGTNGTKTLRVRLH